MVALLLFLLRLLVSPFRPISRLEAGFRRIGAGNPGTWEAGHQSMRVYGR
jgi:hypothetical protein